jgi:hypothetical protein
MRAGEELPFMLHEAFSVLDPYRPIIETEIATVHLVGLFTGGIQGLTRTAKLRVKPHILSQMDSAILERPSGSLAFNFDYVFSDADFKPISTGKFLIPEDAVYFASTLGIHPENCQPAHDRPND